MKVDVFGNEIKVGSIVAMNDVYTSGFTICLIIKFTQLGLRYIALSDSHHKPNTLLFDKNTPQPFLRDKDFLKGDVAFAGLGWCNDEKQHRGYHMETKLLVIDEKNAPDHILEAKKLALDLIHGKI